MRHTPLYSSAAVPFSINTGCTFLSARPIGVVQAGGNDLSISVLLGPQVLRKPALVADENCGVVMVPVGDRVAASPGGVGRLFRPLRIGWAGAEGGEEVEDVAGGHAAIEIGIRGYGNDALLVDRVPDRALPAGRSTGWSDGHALLKRAVPKGVFPAIQAAVFTGSVISFSSGIIITGSWVGAPEGQRTPFIELRNL